MAGSMDAVKSLIVKRSIVLAGHRTSVSLEEEFWRPLKNIAADRRMTLSALLRVIESEHHHGNLSSAIRVFVLKHYRERVDISERPNEGISATEPRIFMRLGSPAERLDHGSATEAYAGSGDSPMGKREEYRRYAKECLHLANSMHHPEARASLRQMAQVWLRLAQDAESRSRQDEVSEAG